MRLEPIQEREATYFLPVVKRLPVALVSGRGSRVVDIAGREYVDLTAGWGVTSIGHCHPALVEAILVQGGRLMQTTNIVYTVPQLDLAEQAGPCLHERLLHRSSASRRVSARYAGLPAMVRNFGREAVSAQLTETSAER